MLVEMLEGAHALEADAHERIAHEPAVRAASSPTRSSAHHLPAMLRLRNRCKGNNGSSKSTG